MPLNPYERLVVLTQFKKTDDHEQVIKTLGHRMSKIGRLSDGQMFDLFEALRVKNKILTDIVLELATDGTLKDCTGSGKLLIDMCLEDDQPRS